MRFFGGCCKTCRAPGPAGRRDDFLCSLCAHPQSVRTFCARCGARKECAPADTERLQTLVPGISLTAGTSIRLPHCLDCQKPGEKDRPLKIEVYAIALA